MLHFPTSRRLKETLPAPALPGIKDPIWYLGHDVVNLLVEYLANG